MLCNKKRGTDAVVEEPLSIVDEVIGNEDLAFLISSVSKKKAFSPILLFFFELLALTIASQSQSLTWYLH